MVHCLNTAVFSFTLMKQDFASCLFMSHGGNGIAPLKYLMLFEVSTVNESLMFLTYSSVDQRDGVQCYVPK